MALFFDENGDVQTSTYDLQDDAVARRWAAEAAQRKPWRPELWALFAELLLKEATSPLRILELGERVSFHLGNFKEPNWPRHVPGRFDAIISMQAVHEIRHKRHVPWFPPVSGKLPPELT